MKIGILTYHNTLSYGAHLQAFALQEYVKSLGHEVKIVDYRGNVYKPMSLIEVLNSVTPGGVVQNYNRYMCIKEFLRFNDNFCLSRRYQDGDSLRKDPPGMDVYITGSDQVWQLRDFCGTSRFDKTYFLDFAEADSKKIAYAPSFGAGVPIERIHEVGPYLKQFNGLSVREKADAETLSNIIGRDVECVIDPTLLIGREGFDKLLINDKCNESGVYAFYYSLLPNIGEDERLIALLRNILGKVYIFNRPLRMAFSGENFLGSPIQWVSKIKNAAFVLTNSFHGTVFSILYHKPFVFLPWKKSHQNRRVRSLLSELGLAMAIQETGMPFQDKISFMCEFSGWGEVDEKIRRLRNQSRLYLQSNLS